MDSSEALLWAKWKPVVPTSRAHLTGFSHQRINLAETDEEVMKNNPELKAYKKSLPGSRMLYTWNMKYDKNKIDHINYMPKHDIESHIMKKQTGYSLDEYSYQQYMQQLNELSEGRDPRLLNHDQRKWIGNLPLNGTYNPYSVLTQLRLPCHISKNMQSLEESSYTKILASIATGNILADIPPHRAVVVIYCFGVLVQCLEHSHNVIDLAYAANSSAARLKAGATVEDVQFFQEQFKYLPGIVESLIQYKASADLNKTVVSELLEIINRYLAKGDKNKITKTAAEKEMKEIQMKFTFTTAKKARGKKGMYKVPKKRSDLIKYFQTGLSVFEKSPPATVRPASSVGKGNFNSNSIPKIKGTAGKWKFWVAWHFFQKEWERLKPNWDTSAWNQMQKMAMEGYEGKGLYPSKKRKRKNQWREKKNKKKKPNEQEDEG